MELSTVQQIVIMIIPLLFAITIHEVAHGWVASYFGDQTARYAGRLTLNPIKHIDPIGTVLLPMMLILLQAGVIFGWAKPVPVDQRNLRHPRRDMALVAFAGPLTNILMAIFWGIVLKAALIMGIEHEWLAKPLALMGQAGVLINIVLAILNLIPLPPLDGSKILGSVLSGRAAHFYYQLEPYSLLILVVLLVSGILSKVMGPLIIILREMIFFIFNIN